MPTYAEQGFPELTTEEWFGFYAPARTPANVVQVVLGGGFAPATAGNPRPYGMPPYATALSDADLAAVLTMIRASWGNNGRPITTIDVQRYRTGSTGG